MKHPSLTCMHLFFGCPEPIPSACSNKCEHQNRWPVLDWTLGHHPNMRITKQTCLKNTWVSLACFNAYKPNHILIQPMKVFSTIHLSSISKSCPTEFLYRISYTWSSLVFLLHHLPLLHGPFLQCRFNGDDSIWAFTIVLSWKKMLKFAEEKYRFQRITKCPC